jgi:hypothetical protein
MEMLKIIKVNLKSRELNIGLGNYKKVNQKNNVWQNT